MEARSRIMHDRVKSTSDSLFLVTLVVTGKSTVAATPPCSSPLANSIMDPEIKTKKRGEVKL